MCQFSLKPMSGISCENSLGRHGLLKQYTCSSGKPIFCVLICFTIWNIQTSLQNNIWSESADIRFVTEEYYFPSCCLPSYSWYCSFFTFPSPLFFIWTLHIMHSTHILVWLHWFLNPLRFRLKSFLLLPFVKFTHHILLKLNLSPNVKTLRISSSNRSLLHHITRRLWYVLTDYNSRNGL